MKKLVSLAVLLIFPLMLSAQSDDEKGSSFKDKLVTGGNVGLNFGNFT